MVRVLFKVRTQAQYDALPVKIDAALYYTTDTQRMYKGDKLFAVGKNATEMAAGLMSPEDKKALNDLIIAQSNKVDRIIDGVEEGSRAIITNENDGGCLKYEHVDGTYSAVAVNNGGSDGIAAQIYSIDKDSNKGVKLDVTRQGIYYTNGDDSSLAPALRDVEDNEIVVRKDIKDLIGVLHFRGVYNSLDEVDDPKNGDVVIVGNKEYVYVNVSGQPVGWKEFGDEGIYVTKAEAQAEHAALSGAINSEADRAKAAEQALASSKQDSFTTGEGFVLKDNVLKYDPDVLSTVTYVDMSISDTLLYVDQQDASEHAGRVAGDNLIKADLAAEVSRAGDAEEALSNRITALEMPIEPEYDSSLNILFLNGNSVRVYDNGSSNTAEWYGAGSSDKSANTLTFPYGASISCGGNGIDRPVSFIGTQLVMDSGNIKTIRGGGLGACVVGNVDIIVNGGTVTGVTGGGQKYTSNLKGQNVVENVHIILNTNLSGQSILCAGGTDIVSVGHAVMDVNADVKWCYASGGNGGYVNDSVVNLNGGTINNFLGVVRGYIASAKVNVNGANVVNMWAGADNDASDNGIIKKAVIDAIEGNITTLHKGYSGLVEGDFECSGHYNSGVIGNEEEAVEECDLVVYVDKSVAVLKNELVAEYTVGGIKYGTVFEAGTSIEHILRELFTNHIPVEETDILYGSSTEIPADISSLSKYVTKDVSVLINDGMVQNIETGDTELIQPQYTVVACKNFLELTDWKNDATKISYMTSVHKVTYGDYNIYYKIPTCYDADIGGEDYKFEFKEAEE